MLPKIFPPDDTQVREVRVGIDFDGTITADWPTWVPLIRVMQLAGWDVRITTWRNEKDHQEVDDFLAYLALPIPVIYCNGFAKRTCFNADIWIDDNPASVMFHLERPPSFKPTDGTECYKLDDEDDVRILATKLECWDK